MTVHIYNTPAMFLLINPKLYVLYVYVYFWYIFRHFDIKRVYDAENFKNKRLIINSVESA